MRNQISSILFIILCTACSGPGSEAPLMESEAVLADEFASDIAPYPESPNPKTKPRAGILTAGDIDDQLNIRAFKRYVGKASKQLGLPNYGGQSFVAAQFIGPNGAPAPGVRVTLRRAGSTEAFYSGYSGVDGHLLVFPGTYGLGRLNKVEMRAFGDSGQSTSQVLKMGRRTVVNLPFNAAWKPDFLDLAFVVDTTGSMGDELAWLTRDLFRIVARAKRTAPRTSIRFGLVVYRDRGDEYVVRNFGFTNSEKTMRRWLRDQSANGGGDYPEAAAAAMATAAHMNWRRGKGERLMFHIADAPPHHEEAASYLLAARQAARENVQIFGLGASGVAAESEFLMRQASAMSGGRYLFLTDDSGVGYGHAEPTISCYRVTALSGLVERVLTSELKGRRIEADSDDIIREVGTYQNGVCRN